jgi:catechol 2,3-dioxygenase-like lactoylglutathione lyase family enzyme
MTLARTHHVGISVSDRDASLAFWTSFLGVEPRWTTVLDRAYLGRNVGYPGLSIHAAFVDLPGGLVLEILDYDVDKPAAVAADATAAPGHMHLCIEVDDIDDAWRRAVEHGARSVYPDGPVDIDGGPNKGARASYLRVPPDWHTLELFQLPPA